MCTHTHTHTWRETGGECEEEREKHSSGEVARMKSGEKKWCFIFSNFIACYHEDRNKSLAFGRKLWTCM